MAQQSKILYIITQSEWGGAQRYIFDLATELQKDNFEVEVATGDHGPLIKKLSTVGIKTHLIPHLVRKIKLFTDLHAYFEIKKLCQTVKPDIVHLNSSKAGVIGAIAARHAGVKKVIYTVHGFVFNEPMSALKKKLYLFAEKFSSRYKDTLITVSEFDKKTGVKNTIAPPQKFVTIHIGIKQIDYLEKKEAREKLQLPLDKKIIGTIANFYPTKGLPFFIAAAALLIKQDPTLLFAMIGDGALRQDLESQIRDLKLENKVILLGTIDDAQRYLKAFDVFTLSSVKEGLPYVILEALQAQVPVVATNVGGIPEIDGIALVPPKRADLLAQAITQALTTPVKIEATLSEEFSLERMVSKTKKIYLDLK